MVEANHSDEEADNKTFVDEPVILEKYRAAATIADMGLKKAFEMAQVGADIFTICQAVDTMMEEECSKVFNSKKTKKLERGIAFPCCISVNNCVGHYSPFGDESVKLAEGDLAKIICGVHIDGFAGIGGHTMIVGNGCAEGKKANVLMAARHAMMAAQRVIKEGSSNTEVTEIMNQVCAEYSCNMVEGVLSHTVKKFCIDGNKVINAKETNEAHTDEWIFAPGDVIGLDIYVSTGEGKPKQAETRTTVYKREIQNMYNLKINKSRQFFAEANRRFPSLPFCLRAFEDQTGAKVGVRECVDHDLLIPYPVLEEKAGEFVAHFKATVAVLPKSTAVLCGQHDLDVTKLKCDSEIKSEELKAVIARDLYVKEKKEKAKK